MKKILIVLGILMLSCLLVCCGSKEEESLESDTPVEPSVPEEKTPVEPSVPVEDKTPTVPVEEPTPLPVDPDFVQNNDTFVSDINLWIVGSHWNNWNPTTLGKKESFVLDEDSYGVDTKYTYTIVVTQEMIDDWCGFRMVGSLGWLPQYGMEDVDFTKSNQAFLDMIGDRNNDKVCDYKDKYAFTEGTLNRNNIVISTPGTFVIEYYPYNFSRETINGVEYSSKLVVKLYEDGQEPTAPEEPTDNPSDLYTIDIWAPSSEEEMIKYAVEEYNKTHSTKIAYNLICVDSTESADMLMKNPTSTAAPALFLSSDHKIHELLDENLIAEIKNDRKANVVDSISPIALESAMINDKLYGYPVTNNGGYFLWYDKSQLTEEQAQSLETILAVAESKEKSFLMDLENGWYVNSFIMSPQACGKNSLYFNAKKVYTTTWDSAVGVKVSEYIASLLTPAYANGSLVTDSNIIDEGFRQGKVIACVSGLWMESSLKNILGENLGAAKLPTYTIDGQDYQMSSFTSSEIYCINKTCSVEEQTLAANLAELLTSEEAQLRRFELNGTLPCNLDAVEDARYTENVSIGAKALLAQNEYACVQAKTAEARYWDIGGAIGQAYIDSILGDYVNWTAFLKAQMDILRAPAV